MTDQRGNESVEGGSVGQGTGGSDVEREGADAPLSPADANARANAIDEMTDGDGALRFDGGPYPPDGEEPR